MTTPTLTQRFRQTLGRALRETGQALERFGVKTASLIGTKYDFYDDPVPYEDFLSRHRQQLPLLKVGKPLIDDKVAFLAPCSTLIGSVRIAAGASVWYGAVLRADTCTNAANQSDVWELPNNNDNTFDNTESDGIHNGGGIFIGEDTNVQDGALLTARSDHTKIGRGVTIGHLAQIHSATVGDYSLIGMGCILSKGTVVASESLIGAGAVVAPHTQIGPGELWVGQPARKIRDLTLEERQRLRFQSSEYVKVAQLHPSELGANLTLEILQAKYPTLTAGNENNEDDEEELLDDSEEATNRTEEEADVKSSR